MSYLYAGRFHAMGASTRHGMTLNEGGSVKYKGGIFLSRTEDAEDAETTVIII